MQMSAAVRTRVNNTCSRVIKLEDRGKLKEYARRRGASPRSDEVVQTDSYCYFKCTWIRNRNTKWSINQKREAKKKMRESWHTEYRFSVLYDVARVYSTRNWIPGGRAILDELRNRGITIVRRFTARKNHLRPRRNGELSIIRVKCYVRWSLAAAASTYFPREEAVGFYVDDRSRMPYHYSSYGTPATSDSESSVME